MNLDNLTATQIQQGTSSAALSQSDLAQAAMTAQAQMTPVPTQATAPTPQAQPTQIAPQTTPQIPQSPYSPQETQHAQALQEAQNNLAYANAMENLNVTIPPVQTQSIPPVQTQSIPPVQTQTTPPVQTQSIPPVQTQTTPPVQTQSIPPVQTQSTPPVPTQTTPPVPTQSQIDPNQKYQIQKPDGTTEQISGSDLIARQNVPQATPTVTQSDPQKITQAYESALTSAGVPQIQNRLAELQQQYNAAEQRQLRAQSALQQWTRWAQNPGDGVTQEQSIQAQSNIALANSEISQASVLMNNLQFEGSNLNQQMNSAIQGARMRSIGEIDPVLTTPQGYQQFEATARQMGYSDEAISNMDPIAVRTVWLANIGAQTQNQVTQALASAQEVPAQAIVAQNPAMTPASPVQPTGIDQFNNPQVLSRIGDMDMNQGIETVSAILNSDGYGQ